MSAVNARILLWGIEGCGKTTTLRTIHAKLRSDLRGELRHVPTRLDPTVRYEVLPISLGEVGGTAMQLELVAVPGADDQAMTRKQLLDEIDGIVLVLDCSPEKIEDNFASIAELRKSLEAYGRPLVSFPIVLQYNKRDIADPFAIEALHRRIGLEKSAVFETIATTGHGVMATLTTISKHVVRALKGSSQEIRTATSVPQPPAEAIPAARIASDEIATNEMEILEVEPATEFEAASHDILEAAILAEGEAEGLEELNVDDAFELSSDSTPEWQLDSNEASKPETLLGRDLRIVSVGQATLDANGGVRLPLVLGDESGQSRSLVLSLRLDALVGPGLD